MLEGCHLKTYEFQVGVGTGSNISLLVATSWGRTPVSSTILRQLGCLWSGSSGRSWTSRFGPLGLQSSWDNLKMNCTLSHMLTCLGEAQVFTSGGRCK